MKLNSLNRDLTNGDKSLSNSYLQHIVELLRTEVAALTAKENALEEITTEHIETQKEVVDTKTVNAEKVNVASINDKIVLTDVINVLADLKVNGKDVLTEGAFEGPFTYKGVTATLPESANAGDVYITNDKVNVFNGTTWDEFVLPVGTVSLAEYNADKAEILTEISGVQNGLNETKADLATTNTMLNEAIIDINDINTKLETKVDEAPKNENAYVRKNGEWVEQTTADNTVKAVAGESTIDNTEEGVSISSPKVEITTEDFKINGSDLPEVDKLALTKTTVADTDYHYELKFGRSPFDATSSIRPMYVGYGDSYHTMSKAAPEQFTVFTKNFQYTKWGTSEEGSDNAVINITAMDKDGNINLVANNFIDWIKDSTTYLQNTCFITFNQEYVPEGFEDTVYLFNPGKPYLAELKDGKFSRKIDVYNKTGGLKEQGYTPSQFAPDCSRYIGLVGGKGLRNKEIQRICIVCFNTANIGGTWAIIIGGDKNSNVTDPFDPTKCIYVPLPATARYGYASMAATDSAWYLQEEGTGRMMRITPNGQVVELNLTEKCKCTGYCYIEYTDKNNRPAAAYYIQNSDATSGGHYVVFVEEGENGQVDFIERKVESEAFTPKGLQLYSQFFKFMENSNYIFFTADFGVGASGQSSPIYGSASMKNMLWYWDKKTHTTHAINNFYEGLTFDEHSFIEMHKTKGNAIWFPYLIQSLAADKRTGELHFISDADYTEIDEETGKDIGEIQVQTATVGTDNSFFTASADVTTSQVTYTHGLQGAPSWTATCVRNQLSATNDDGILCIISGDLKSIALCYGDGNIKVYPVSSVFNAYECDADKEPYIPDEISQPTYWNGVPTLYGLSHGWALCIKSIIGISSGISAQQDASYTYIGVRYRNGEPTILTAPHLNKIIRCGSNFQAQRIKFEKYAYLQTYDDYERRKKVLGEIRANIGYAVAQTGCDGWFKEVREEQKKLNLTYNGKVISSVDD